VDRALEQPPGRLCGGRRSAAAAAAAAVSGGGGARRRQFEAARQAGAERRTRIVGVELQGVLEGLDLELRAGGSGGGVSAGVGGARRANGRGRGAVAQLAPPAARLPTFFGLLAISAQAPGRARAPPALREGLGGGLPRPPRYRALVSDSDRPWACAQGRTALPRL
jgi:hypothetical protein